MATGTWWCGGISNKYDSTYPSELIDVVNTIISIEHRFLKLNLRQESIKLILSHQIIGLAHFATHLDLYLVCAH